MQKGKAAPVLLMLMLILLWTAFGVEMRREDVNATRGGPDLIPTPTPTATEVRPGLPPLQTAPPLPTIPNVEGGGKAR